MMLATTDDYDLPHIDWECRACGSAYVSTGVPDEQRCFEGHSARWLPNKDQRETYIDFLQSLTPGDGVVIVGEGPVPLMGRVESVGDTYIITESIDNPARVVEWDAEDTEIEWGMKDTWEDEYGRLHKDVYHVESVEVLG